MKETAKEIRDAIKRAGLKASVVCRGNYTIKVTADAHDQVMPIAAEVYNRKPHAWLMVQVNGHWLPMSAPAAQDQGEGK